MQIRKALLIAVSALLLFSCKKASDNVILIGVNAELTGNIPVVGESCQNAAKLAADEINRSGGLDVGGKKMQIQVIVEDNEDKPESAAAVAQKLASTSAVAMIGPNPSRNAIPASQVAESAKLPMITPWSTNPKTTLDPKSNQPKKFIFRAGFLDDAQGLVAARFAIDELKSKKPAVLFDVAGEYNKGLAEIYKKTMEANGVKIVAFETYSTNDKDFSAQLTKIKSSGADSLFLPNYYNEVPLQVEQARRIGYKGDIFGADGWGSPELLTLCKNNCEGLYYSTHYSEDMTTEKAKAFIAAYEAMYKKKPDDVAALTYDAMQLIIQSIKQTGKADRLSLREALATLSKYEGVTGTMKFHGTGDPVKSIVMIRIKDGKQTYFKSVNP